ncbi:ParB N-terminal domain-containing protein [Ensifer soli]|uniref:ParB N-terminal domain-containing protein n=1 Tax=Ciceribacter sp. sgz301302 TaxID=3342379 RepID=UPI0035B9D1D3
MASYKSIPLTSIHLGERARPVDEEHAQAIAASMAERGLINPITVRGTPAANGGKTPYTLVAGGHRLRGAEINAWAEIDAIVVSADAVEAQLMEISENLYRNELTALDRAVFVKTFRDLWEEKNGKIKRGGDRKSNRNDCGLIFSNGRELSERVKDRFGIGQRSYEYASKIGKQLHAGLRSALRGTPWENDQKQLLKLASMSPTEQAGIAAALKYEPDLKAVLAMNKPEKPKPSPDQAAFAALLKAWEKAPEAVRHEFLVHIGIADGFSEAAE